MPRAVIWHHHWAGTVASEVGYFALTLRAAGLPTAGRVAGRVLIAWTWVGIHLRWASYH